MERSGQTAPRSSCEPISSTSAGFARPVSGCRTTAPSALPSRASTRRDQARRSERTLDGTPYRGARSLAPGVHKFSIGPERTVCLWAPAYARGFSPFTPAGSRLLMRQRLTGFSSLLRIRMNESIAAGGLIQRTIAAGVRCASLWSPMATTTRGLSVSEKETAGHGRGPFPSGDRCDGTNRAAGWQSSVCHRTRRRSSDFPTAT